jgi:hypothetical protein
VGDYRTERLFTLRQSVVAYRNYQQLINDCDREIRRALDGFQPPAPPTGSDSDKPASESKRKAASADAGLRTELKRVFGVDIFHLVTTRQEFDDTRFAADQLHYAKRQEDKLRSKAHALGFQLIPLDNAGSVP